MRAGNSAGRPAALAPAVHSTCSQRARSLAGEQKHIYRAEESVADAKGPSFSSVPCSPLGRTKQDKQPFLFQRSQSLKAVHSVVQVRRVISNSVSQRNGRKLPRQVWGSLKQSINRPQE